MRAVPRTVEVEIEGLRWSVRVAGSGPALLLLHGFTGSWRSWDELANAAIAAGCTVIAPDLPGHGGTAWSAARATVERTADDVAALLRALGYERAHVLGYSMGARVALRMAQPPSPAGRGRPRPRRGRRGRRDQGVRLQRLERVDRERRLV